MKKLLTIPALFLLIVTSFDLLLVFAFDDWDDKVFQIINASTAFWAARCLWLKAFK